MSAAILAEALHLSSAHLSVLPIRTDGTKAPAIASWAEYQRRRATEDELRAWFGNGRTGIAIIGGAVSLNTECIDFDDEESFWNWISVMKEQARELVQRLVLVRTPRPGYSVWYRCEQPVPGNSKLARGLRTDADGVARVKALIETRGEGGYAIIPPSPGECHPSGRPYELIHGELADRPLLTADERSLLIETAQSLNEFVEPENRVHQAPRQSGGGDRPGDIYNRTGSWSELLEKHGWTRTRTRGEVEYWLRPGKDDDHRHLRCSATLGHIAPGILFVFSSNAYPFKDWSSYDLFGAYARLEHGGDMSAAGTSLYQAGYTTLPVLRKYESPTQQDKTPVTIADPDPIAVDETDAEAEEIHRTDLGNSLRLVKKYSDRLRFSKSHGWLVYDKKRWKRDDLQEAIVCTKATIRSIYVEAAESDDRKERKQLADWALASESSSRVMAMLKLAESDPKIAISSDILDLDPWLLNCENGTINLKTGAVRLHNPSDHLTRLTRVSFCPTAQCPNWLQFVSDVMSGRQELIDYLQRWAGYCLTGDISEQKLLFLYGMGSNGKTTFLRVLMHMLGDYASVATPGLLLEHRNEQHPTAIAELAGQRMIVSSEVGQGKRLAEELLKQLTGTEPIKTRFMNKDFFQFDPQYKLLLSANHKPVIRGTDEAIWRRIPVVPFTVTFSDRTEPRKDKRIFEKLVQELPGILNWCLKGCLLWQEEGLIEPDVVQEAAASYRAEMDVLGAFLDECCEEVDSTFSVRSSSLYERYKEWCSMTGEQVTSQVIFSSQMSERGFVKDRDKQGVFWFGLLLMEPPKKEASEDT